MSACSRCCVREAIRGVWTLPQSGPSCECGVAGGQISEAEARRRSEMLASLAQAAWRVCGTDRFALAPSSLTAERVSSTLVGTLECCFSSPKSIFDVVLRPCTLRIVPVFTSTTVCDAWRLLDGWSMWLGERICFESAESTAHQQTIVGRMWMWVGETLLCCRPCLITSADDRP